jgi:hypothetical protein
MAPFVKVGLGSAENGVTVGNKSFPSRPHEAIIKSFEYNKSNGMGLTIEIFDEQGGAFDKFFQDMPKKLEEFDTKPKVRAQFGWVGSDCNGPMSPILSPIIEAEMTNIETSFSEGKIKFIVTANDVLQAIFASRHSDSFGGDKVQKMHLKDAIIKLFGEKPPTCKVEFLKKSQNGGSPVEWDFGGPNIPPRGPKDRWTTDNQNKLAAAMEWLEPFHTKDDKGIVPSFDPLSNTIIFWEDPEGCKNENNCENSIGTFIVNGGLCSPVISFSPQINWMVSFNKFGAGGGNNPANSEPIKKDNKICPGTSENTGAFQSVLISAQAVNHFMEKAGKETEKSQSEHTKANAIFMQKEPIKAELRIVGNPAREFCGVKETVIRWASVVVINPFHLVGGGGRDCADWLAEPGCNTYLSHKKWKITGVCHNISEGSYTTTISLELPQDAKNQG